MSNKQKIILLSIVGGLVLLGVATRLLPHPANFTAVGAVSLFAGAVMPKKWGIFFPAIIMAASDIFLGFHNIMVFTWGSMMIAAGIGYLIRQKIKPANLVYGSLVASIQFFLITNWAVWMFTPLYSKGLDGLFASYVAGLPFFRNMLLGDIAYTALLFGVYTLALHYIAGRKQVGVYLNNS